LLKLQDVSWINVPHYAELAVKTLYEYYKNDEELMLYLPDKFAKGRQIDRSYFFNVLNTIRPTHVKQIV